MNVIDRIPLPLNAIVTVLMLGAPFFPEPHLAQKWGILLAGTLTRPIYILDVFGICFRRSCSHYGSTAILVTPGPANP